MDHDHRRSAPFVEIVVFEAVQVKILSGERVFAFKFVSKIQKILLLC
jgi:hypothetical protein